MRTSHIKLCELHAAFAAAGQAATRSCGAKQTARAGEQDPAPGNLHIVFGQNVALSRQVWCRYRRCCMDASVLYGMRRLK